ncbi:hypothetical protein [Sphingomonas solaris]|uniref:hypothetical protein n=1 Tax=Alterirhizorhabdus solaris TaxID=2529389 RepID=UPI001939DA31|nr:hypothetical protein [Sphingomonas solaris]
MALVASGGTLSFDGLNISTDAIGGNGGAGGNAGTGQTPTNGVAGIGGDGIAGNVTLATGDVDEAGTTRFGRITGGVLTIDASGNPGIAGDFGSVGVFRSGRVALLAEGRYLSPGEGPVGSVALTSLDITAFGDTPGGFSPTRDPSLASVDVLARGGRISIADSATIRTGYHASLRVEDDGRIDIGNTLDVFGESFVTATQAGGNVATPANLITAGTVSFRSNGDVVSDAPIVATRMGDTAGTILMTGNTVQADGLTATDAITLQATSFVRAGNLATTAAVDPAATSLDEAGGGTITLIAGQSFNTDLLPDVTLADADLEITGTISASNAIRATAGGDIRVLDGAQILSGNFLGLDAGDDVTVASGAVLRAALAPLADPAAGTGPLDLDSPAGLVITAGRQPTLRAVDGDFATVTIAGTVSSGIVANDTLSANPADRRGILLAGDAVQTEGGTIAGRSLAVQVDDAPLPSIDRTGGVENLTAGCLLGDVCLGAVDLTDLLTVGPLDGTVGLPSSVRIAAGSQTRRTSIRAQGDILLGGSGGATTFGGSELLRVQSTLGAVRLANDTVLSGTTTEGVVQVLGATGIDGPGGSVRGAGTVGLSTGSGGLELAELVAGDHVETLNPDLSVSRTDGLTVAGPVTINRLFSVGNGDANVDATGDVSIERITVGDGFGIAIASSGGSAFVRDATASDLGTAGSVSVASDNGTATLLAADARGTIGVFGGLGATGGLLDGTDITVVSTGGDATIDQGNARRDILLSAAGLASANFLNAGDDIDVSGASVVIDRAITTGTFVESGYGGDGSNIRLDALGALTINTEVSAFDTARLTSTNGSVTAPSLIAGDDVIVRGNSIVLTAARTLGTGLETGYGATPDGSNIRLTATAGTGLPIPSIQLTTADAFDDAVLVAEGAGTIAATSLTAGRDATATAGGAIGITAAQAGRDILLTSTGDAIHADSLLAGRDIAIAALGDVTLGDARADGPVLLSDDPTASTPIGGIVSISAGRMGDTGPYAAADITIDGIVSAEGAVLATAGRDIAISGTGRVLSANRVTLNAGDDVRIAAGAEVRAALNPLPVTPFPGGGAFSPAALELSAGNVSLAYAPPAGNVAAVVVDGLISVTGRPLTLRGGAIQASGSVIEAGSLTAFVSNAPQAGVTQSNDNGGLTTCLQGDVCLGAVSMTSFFPNDGDFSGLLDIGGSAGLRPTNVRITGPVTAGKINIAALDSISLGTRGTAPISQTAAGRLRLEAQSGAVNLLGNLTLTGGAATGEDFDTNLNIIARSDVAGASARIVSRGTMNVLAGRSIDLSSTSSAGGTTLNAQDGSVRIGSATTTAILGSDGRPNGVQIFGGTDVTAGTIDATGDFVVLADRDIRVDRIVTRTGGTGADQDGSDILVQADGAVVLGDVTASDDAQITAGTTLTLTSLTARGETTNDGADLGGNVVLGGQTVNAGSLTAATNITATAGDLLRVDFAQAGGTVELSANGVDRAATGAAPDGTLAVTLGTIDAGTALQVSAPNGGIRFDSLAAPVIALTAGTRIAGGDLTARSGGIDVRAPGDVRLGTAIAADDIFVTAGGSVLADSLTSGSDESDARYRAIEIVAGGTIGVTGASTAFRGDVDYTAAGAITIGAASAGDSVLLLSNDGGITAGALVAGTYPAGAVTDEEYRGAIGVSAALDAAIGSATAPGDIGILSRGGSITAGDIRTDANAVLLAANAVTTGAVSTTDRFYVANASMAALLGEDADPARLDGVTPVATGGAVTLRGAVTAGPVTVAAGDALGFTTIASTDAMRLSSARGAIAGDIVRAAGDITLAAAGTVRVATDIATPGTISATGTGIALNALGALRIATADATAGDVSLTSSGGAVSVDRATATGNVRLASGSGVNGTPDDARTVTALDVRAGNDVTVTALGRVDVRDVTAGRTILLSSASDVRLGTATAGLDVLASGRTSVDAGTVVAGRDLELVTRYVVGDTRPLSRSVTLGSGRAGDDIVLAAFGRVQADSLVTTGAGADAGDGQYGNREGSGIYVVSQRGTLVGTATSAGAIDYINVAQTIGDFLIGDGSGDIRVGAQAAAGDITALNGNSAITFTSAVAGGAIDLTAGGDAGAITADDLRAGGALSASASGDLSIGVGRAASTIMLESTRGALAAVDLQATDGIEARAAGTLSVRDAVATATTGNVTLAAGFPFAAGSGAAAPYLLAGNTSVTGTVSAGRSVRIEAGGDLSLGAASRVRSNGAIFLASGDDIVVDAGGVIGLGHVTVATPGTATGARVGGPADSVTLNAGLLRAGTANAAENGASGIVMNGTVDGLRLALLSEAIGVGTSGRVGSAVTELASYANNGTGLTTIGGTGEAAGYAVSQQVLGRTRAQAIRVSGAGDVAVQALTLAGSAAADGNLVGNAASFEIQTPGSVRVEGAAVISSAAQTDLFAITAGDRITVVTPGGSIALRDTGNALAGRLRLAARRITVATPAAIGAIEGLSGVDAKDERLGANDGTTSEAGFLQANAIEFRVSNGLYIQNSGTGTLPTARRGITAGTGGIAIATTGTTPAEIVLNGRQPGADGTLVSGAALIPLLRLSGTAQGSMASLDPRSTANGCLISGLNCRFDPVITDPDPDPDPDPESPVLTPPRQPVQDVINAIIDGQDSLTGAISSVVQQLNSPLIELIDFTPFRLSGIIDEPVTGAGNDDFYTTFDGGDALTTGISLNEQVTGSGNDDLTAKAEKDGRCDSAQSATDPDCN